MWFVLWWWCWFYLVVGWLVWWGLGCWCVVVCWCGLVVDWISVFGSVWLVLVCSGSGFGCCYIVCMDRDLWLWLIGIVLGIVFVVLFVRLWCGWILLVGVVYLVCCGDIWWFCLGIGFYDVLVRFYLVWVNCYCWLVLWWRWCGVGFDKVVVVSVWCWNCCLRIVLWWILVFCFVLLVVGFWESGLLVLICWYWVGWLVVGCVGLLWLFLWCVGFVIVFWYCWNLDRLFVCCLVVVGVVVVGWWDCVCWSGCRCLVRRLLGGFVFWVVVWFCWYWWLVGWSCVGGFFVVVCVVWCRLWLVCCEWVVAGLIVIVCWYICDCLDDL